MVSGIFRAIGRAFLALVRDIGRRGVFLADAAYYSVVPPYRWRLVIQQVWFLGYKSLTVIFMTGAFAGMVLALQLFHTLSKFGAVSLLGPGIALSLVRELGPVFAALMVTGRAGSALTAELGIMRISEQIDCLYVMALNPYKYVVVPNFIAALIAFPLLTAIFDVVGIFGGYLVGVELLGIGSGEYFDGMRSHVGMDDIMIGFYKSLAFAVIVTWVCCYKGFYVGYGNSGHGARAVSRATTDAVVQSSVLVLVWDYILGSFFI
ncbi:MAG: ABC transporter permease [Nitrospirae bacterium]|uniref:MlaE family ABC transporter permease n=1 Tax=Candidatus Magnetobacterium casense TaxID=1455061 RepID=UPI00058D0B49|nr:MlaE family lipid ABC transporter permease subunit [Candidatus Magnetobacterium casensis]MBF0337038.1 ABC transporter permease [Nitrospirota bacterium]